MSSPHVIRLRGPWRCVPLSRTVILEDGTLRDDCEDLPSPTQLSLSDSELAPFGEDFTGRVLMQRSFHRPTGIDTETSMYVVVNLGGSSGLIWLNDELLGEIPATSGCHRFAMGPSLSLHNRLSVELQLESADAQDSPKQTFELFLEIDPHTMCS